MKPAKKKGPLYQTIYAIRPAQHSTDYSQAKKLQLVWPASVEFCPYSQTYERCRVTTTLKLD